MSVGSRYAALRFGRSNSRPVCSIRSRIRIEPGSNWARVNRFIADGDRVAVEARGDNLTTTGTRYDNDYRLVFRLENGKIKEVREYCDSVLTERALGRFFEAPRRATG